MIEDGRPRGGNIAKGYMGWPALLPEFVCKLFRKSLSGRLNLNGVLKTCSVSFAGVQRAGAVSCLHRLRLHKAFAFFL